MLWAICWLFGRKKENFTSSRYRPVYLSQPTASNRQLSAASRSQQPPAVSRRPQTPAAASNRANNLSQPQTTVYSRRQQPSASIRQHRIGAAWIASVRLPLAIRMSGEGLYARQHKKPLSMTGKTVRLRGFRAYIKALSFLSIVVLLKSSFVFGEDCIFDFVPCFW